MTKRAAYSAADVSRLVRGAIRGGMPVGSFKLVVDNGRPTLLPIDPGSAVSSADDAEAEWDKALGLQS